MAGISSSGELCFHLRGLLCFHLPARGGWDNGLRVDVTSSGGSSIPLDLEEREADAIFPWILPDATARGKSVSRDG
jgi:hypothetical protein